MVCGGWANTVLHWTYTHTFVKCGVIFGKCHLLTAIFFRSWFLLTNHFRQWYVSTEWRWHRGQAFTGSTHWCQFSHNWTNIQWKTRHMQRLIVFNKTNGKKHSTHCSSQTVITQTSLSLSLSLCVSLTELYYYFTWKLHVLHHSAV